VCVGWNEVGGAKGCGRFGGFAIGVYRVHVCTYEFDVGVRNHSHGLCNNTQGHILSTAKRMGRFECCHLSCLPC